MSNPQTLAEYSLQVANAMSEKAFQERVLRIARTQGWRCMHPYDSRRSTPGFPDLTMVHAATGRLLFVELKTAKGRISKDQEAWLDDLETVQDRTWPQGANQPPVVQVHVWRPVDLVSGVIAEALAGIR